MAINFPDNPSNGQQVTVGGVRYEYNSTKNAWKKRSIQISAASSGGGVTSYDSAGLLPSSSNIAGDLAFVKDNKAMYVWDSSEWDRLYNGPETSLTWTTEALSSYSLEQDGTSTTITTAANDPEGFPITYSYDVTPTNQTQATIVDSGNGNFVLTPSTNDSDAGSFTFRSKATDGLYSISKSSTISLAFTLADADTIFFAAMNGNTTDSVNGITGTGGQMVNITLDNGSTTQALTTASGSGATRISYPIVGNVSSLGLDANTSNFTIEWWGYRIGGNATYRTWIEIGNGASNSYTNGILYRNKDPFVTNSNITNSNLNTDGALNTWVHHAIVFQNGTYRFYQGNKGGTSTQVYTLNQASGFTALVNGFTLMDSRHTTGQTLSGYMRLFRISTVARYPDGTSFPAGGSLDFNSTS